MSPLREQAIAEIDTMSDYQLNILIQVINSLKDFNSKPDNLSDDPFYQPDNVRRILNAAKSLDEGRGVEHELIEVG